MTVCLSAIVHVRGRPPPPCSSVHVSQQLCPHVHACSHFFHSAPVHNSMQKICCDLFSFSCLRSSAHAHMGQWSMALQDANACINIRPKWSRGHACRGAALEGLGRIEEALTAFQTAKEQDPSNHGVSLCLHGCLCVSACVRVCLHPDPNRIFCMHFSLWLCAPVWS